MVPASSIAASTPVVQVSGPSSRSRTRQLRALSACLSPQLQMFRICDMTVAPRSAVFSVERMKFHHMISGPIASRSSYWWTNTQLHRPFWSFPSLVTVSYSESRPTESLFLGIFWSMGRIKNEIDEATWFHYWLINPRDWLKPSETKALVSVRFFFPLGVGMGHLSFWNGLPLACSYLIDYVCYRIA